MLDAADIVRDGRKVDYSDRGVLLCASKDDEVVENGLSRTLSPALIAGQLAELMQRSSVC